LTLLRYTVKVVAERTGLIGGRISTAVTEVETMKLFALGLIALAAAFSIGAYGDEPAAEPTDSERSEMNAKEEFPENRWEEMRTRMETGGAAAVAEFVGAFNDEEKLKLYSFAQRAFYGREWEGKSFDGYIDIVNAGIAEGVRQAEAASDPEDSAKLLDFANVLSYNLSADLAECWPGDTLPRERRHFEAGLKAAEDCLRWREELKKGPFPFSIAYWAKGMHQLSLGEAADALENFVKSYDYAREYARAEGKDDAVSAEGDFVVILGAGYVGLAEWVQSAETGQGRYEEAVAAFREGAQKYPDKKDDFQFGIDQLEWVKKKFIK
jgi:tetratricopeptide (TPR) repeat protein